MARIEADAVITDPPYGIGHMHSGIGGTPETLNGGNPIGGMVWKLHGDNKPFDPRPWLEYKTVVLWGANHYASRLPDKPCWLSWDKHLRHIPGLSFSECEFAWTNIKAKKTRCFRFYWQGALRSGEANAQVHLHPTQKPVELMAWCMEVAKLPENCTVLDPYMGSGTTGIACLRTNRNFIGVEIDPEHFATAVARLEREANQGVLL